MAVEETSYRRSVWVSSLIALVGLALFIGIAVLIPPPAGQVGVLLLSLFLALIPAAIWLVFFYQQDRAEPEPKQLVVRIFDQPVPVAGGAAAADDCHSGADAGSAESGDGALRRAWHARVRPAPGWRGVRAGVRAGLRDRAERRFCD